MINRLFYTLFLLACAVTLSATANAQVVVLSRTTIVSGTVVAKCQTQRVDGDTIRLYPSGVAECTLKRDSAAIQHLGLCFDTPNTFVATCQATVESVIQGVNYQTTGRHGVVMTLLAGFCTGNTDCLWDPLSYGSPSDPPPANRQFTDSGTIFRGNVESFWAPQPPGAYPLIATTTEPQFQTAHVLPAVLRTRVDDDPKQFNLSGNQIANWTFTGSSGTSTAPSQGISVTFTPPHPPLAVQQVDTLEGCKVDISHGIDCNSAQIIVEVLGVTIPPSNWDLEPPTNPDELLGGEKVKYNAITTQGARNVAFTVTWAKTAETSGGNFVTVDADGTVTVQPQDAFPGNEFDVDIQATNPIDPTVAKSGIFQIHIPTVTVKLTTTPFPDLNEPPFEARETRKFRFVATVTGPQRAGNRLVTWSQKVLTFAGNPGVFTFPLTDGDTTDYLIPSGFPPTQAVTVTISACVGGTVDAFGDPVHAICDTFPLSLVPPVHATSPPRTINSGESTPVTIAGTGFGAAPTLSFSDPTVTFTPVTFSGPDASGVTTVTGTMTAAPVPATIPFTLKVIPVTLTSSLPPPSTPANQDVLVRPVTTTPAVTPVNPTLIVSQSQQFTASLGCQTAGGQTCTVPQTSTCSLTSGPGTMSTSCLYTAPASLAAQTQVVAKACFTFGNVCKTFSINLIPITVAVSPAAVSLRSGQSQQFQATVTNVPNNNQGVTWSISPAAGSITAAGLYTAPAVVSAAQTISITACSVVNTTQCSSATVTLVPPNFGAPFLASSNFTDAQGWNQSAYYPSLRSADVNGDGKPDLCGRGLGGIVCALNNGNGSFSAATQWEGSFTDAAGWNQAQYGTTIMFADINGDGKADVCGRGGAGIVCELSTGTGFGAIYLASTDFSDAQGWNSNAAYYGSLRLADVNGDGKPDICGRFSGGVICALNNGNGTFAPVRQWEGSFTDPAGWNQAQYGTTMVFADINGDGKADVCGRGGAGIYCELSTGTGFGAIYLASTDFSDAQGWNQSAYYISLRLADVNGDGRPDLCGRGLGGIVCALNNGDGTFAPARQWESSFTDASGWNQAQYGTTIMFADINGDGRADVCGRGVAGIACELSVP